jgi:regulatory protein
MARSSAEGSSNGDLKELTERMARYCAAQERCIYDVTLKMQELKAPAEIGREVIEYLQANRYIDEERYAREFARGKFRVNRWGRIRIGYELKGRRIPGAAIARALQEIDEQEYDNVLRSLIVKKQREIKSGKNLNIREKIITFVRGKGFEPEIAIRILNELKI